MNIKALLLASSMGLSVLFFTGCNTKNADNGGMNTRGTGQTKALSDGRTYHPLGENEKGFGINTTPQTPNGPRTGTGIGSSLSTTGSRNPGQAAGVPNKPHRTSANQPNSLYRTGLNGEDMLLIGSTLIIGMHESSTDGGTSQLHGKNTAKNLQQSLGSQYNILKVRNEKAIKAIHRVKKQLHAKRTNTDNKAISADILFILKNAVPLK